MKKHAVNIPIEYTEAHISQFRQENPKARILSIKTKATKSPAGFVRLTITHEPAAQPAEITEAVNGIAQLIHLFFDFDEEE